MVHLWNKILRDCGFDCIIDPGMGIIHGNEKTQAIFLTRSALKAVEVIDNRQNVGPIILRHLADRTKDAATQIVKGNLTKKECLRLIQRNHKIFAEIANRIPRDYANDIMDELPEVTCQAGLPDWAYENFVTSPKHYREFVEWLRFVPDKYVAQRIERHPGYSREIAIYNFIHHLGPLAQQTMARLDPLDYALISNPKQNADPEAVKLALSHVDEEHRQKISDLLT